MMLQRILLSHARPPQIPPDRQSPTRTASGSFALLREVHVLVRGTWGIGGRCGRTGGMREALGGSERQLEGVGGRALPPLLREGEEEDEDEDDAMVGSGAPRMCTIPAPSRVSSNVHGFEVADAVDGVRPTAGVVVVAVCCQSYAITPRVRTGAGKGGRASFMRLLSCETEGRFTKIGFSI
jgi:hypothetical protein